MSTTTLRSAVTRTPQTTAVVFDKEEVSYADLHRRANQLAHYLQAMGVGPDVPVGVLLERSLETIVTLLAIFKAGGAYVPLDPEYPDERLRFMMRDAGLELVVTQAKLTSRLGDAVVQSIRVDADWAEIANESQDNPPLLASASHLAYIIYTSGSTGTPKGAMVTRGGMLNCLQWMQQRYELTKQDAFLMHTSLNFDSSVWEVFWPLLAGVRLVIAPADMLESSALLRYMAEQSVSCAFFVPSQLAMLVQEPGLSEMTSLRYVITGGEKLPLGVMREFQELSRAELHNAYGPTETAIAATEWTCEAGAERVLIGRPIGNTQVYVLNEQMEPLPVGVEGELYIGGAGVGRGYAGQAELTAERFVPHPFSSKPGARLYRTGDLVRYDAAGQLEFVDRVDQQVKVRGSRIELGEIEAVLRRHAQVSEAVVVLNEADGDKRLVAYVVSEVEAHELREYLKARLPDYMVPSFFVALNDLPLLPNGKLNRRALPAPASMVLAETEYVAPRTATEELLAGLWARVLRVNSVGINDNFFELGGHSLLATQVISRVRDVFGQEVALRSLFEQPTVAGLAREIEAGRGLGAELQAPPLERVERAERLPLSFAQQRLWFLDQLEPGSSFYNIPAAVRLRGVLNVAALERTLSEVVRRHEVLRTHFIAIDGEPVQVIEPAAPLPLEVVELSALAEEAREAEVLRLAQLEAGRPFELWRGPLLRVGLLRLGKEEHVALVTMHHIVSDGWSMGVFINEVATLYAAYVRGEESPLEELPIQYADFAHWQRGWLQGEVLAAQLDYWRAELAGAPTVIDLPIDKPRPPVQTYRGAYQPLQLSAALSAQLRDLSRQNGSTLFMTLLAAFDLLLCRYAGQEQVLVGTPIANRNRSEIEGLIGFFVNTLVLRGDVRGNPSFSELLRRVRETALSAYAHQDLPFEKLVEELQPERDLSRSPLFQVMFALQNAPGEVLALPGLTLSTISPGNAAAKFELGLTLQEVEGCISGEMDYNVDLYERTTIERLSEHFKTLLQSMVANVERPVAELRLLSEAEERQLLYEWNEQAADFDSDLFIHELFAAQAAQHPEAVAVVFENEQLTYEELNRRANQLAHHLQGLGVGPEVVVGIFVERSVEMVVALLGILKAGAAYLPLDPSYPAERLSFMIADAGVRFIISHQAVEAVLPDSALYVLLLDAEWATVATQPETAPEVRTAADNLAYVIYTSGSTGQPKGVMISHLAISNHMQWMAEQFPLRASEAVLQKTPFSFDASVWEFYAPLLAGARLVLARPGGHQEAQYLTEVMEREGVTRLQGVPTLLRMLVNEGGLERCTQLREVFSGGEVLGRELADSLLQAHSEVKLYNLYGPTEATIDTTWDEAERERVYAGEEVSIGRPIANLQVYVLDDRMQLAPVGVVGELYIGGAGLARGYLNRPTLTAERFVPHPYSTEPGARLYRTGDMVRWLESGKLAYVGRVDAQVKLRGFRVELSEIEVVLREHASVKECLVLVQDDQVGSQQLVGYILSAERAASVAELRDHLRERLPEYMVPAVYMIMEEWPLTATGKVDVRALPQPAVKRDKLTGGYVEPATPVQQILTGIWEELLNVRPVGVRDDFFSLGGHSLLAVRLMARIQASFGQHLPLASLFQGATIEKLASLLHEQPHDHGASALVAIQPNGDGLPFFCVHPGGGNVLCYNELSNHLGFERPFYGLQARGLLENQIPHTRIEDMAAYYIDAIRTVRPDGPYLLGGWSMGGVVAYEMARQLEGLGQEVSLLALMDARPVTAVDDAAPLDELTLLTNFARDLGLPVDGLQLSTDELAKLDSDELLSHVLQRAIETGIVPGDIQLAHARKLFEVFKINVQAMQSYRPEASSTRVTFLRAGEQEVADETMGWGALTSGEIEIHRVPGDHFTIVREPYVRSLAEQLADCINRAALRSLASHT